MKVRVWKAFLAPNGRHYYYNLKTKQTTWDKPESLFVESYKKVPLEAERPVFAFPLINDWYLIISSYGNKFYYNSSEDRSVLEPDDELNRQLLDFMDKERILLLIGVARGYNYTDYLKVYEDVLEDLRSLKNDILNEYNRVNVTVEPTESKDICVVEPMIVENNRVGILAGYESSSEEDSEEDIHISENEMISSSVQSRKEEEEEDNSSNAYLNLTSADDIEFSQAKKKYFEIFETNDLNPFSTWSKQSKIIINDPDFYLVSDNTLRGELFEQWCATKISQNQDNEVDEENINTEDGDNINSNDDDDTEEEEEEEDDDELEPTKYHYLAHIISKTAMTPTTIFQDIKRENKKLFKQFKINDCIKSKKDQEEFSSKLLFYYKKFNNSQRIEIFQNMLKQNNENIKMFLEMNKDKLRSVLEEDTNEDFEKETQLLKIEDFLHLQQELSKMSLDPKYYVLGIKDKLETLKTYLNSEL